MKKAIFGVFVLIYFSILITSCQTRYQMNKGTVSLNWPKGDIAFISDRSTPSQTRGWDGPLYLMNINSKQWMPIKNSKQFTLGIVPTWSPDGETLAFRTVLSSSDVPNNSALHGYDGTIFLDVQGNRSVFGNKLSRSAVTWSSDGQYVAFYSQGDDKYSLNVSRPDGTNEQEIVTNLPRELFGDLTTIRNVRISWSPDEQYIAYDSLDKVGNKQIWLVSKSGDPPQKLIAGSHPAWSPLGNEIAFDRDGSVWIVNLENEKEELLIEATASPWLYDGWPTWSPDGQQLAFVSSRDGNAEIYIINRDGSGLENLTNHPSNDAFPAWRPKKLG